MTYGRVQFVEQPASSPIVLLDVNRPETDGMYVRGEDFTLGAPQWETAPGLIGGDDGFREIEFTVAVDGSYVDAAANMSALSRMLQRDRGWLLLQRDPAVPPMFLRWYRSTPQPVDWELWHVDTYTLPVHLTCDPYLYGEPISLGPYTISNRPDSGTNRAFRQFTADTFVGDAPAPLKVTITPSTALNGYQHLIGTTALAPSFTQSQPTWVDLTAANWTAGASVGGDVADSAYVGGSYRLWTATGSAIQARLSGSITPPVPGLYKVLVRCTLTADQSTFNLRLTQTYSGSQTYSGPTVPIVRPDTTITQYSTWADLGGFAFPFGVYDLSTLDAATPVATPVSIDGERISGTANMRFDALLLVPIETATTLDSNVSTWRFHGTGLSSSRQGVWDGQRRKFDAYESGARSNLRTPEQRGGWPRVTPGVVNLLHFLQQTQTDSPLDTTVADDDVITDTVSLTASYLPRYLHLRT